MDTNTPTTALKLDRPLAVFDIESTGINRKLDRIIDLAIIKVFPDGQRETHTFRVNPEMKIPPASTEIHGISDADVIDAPTFKEVASDVAHVLEECDLAGFNLIYFDIPMLMEEFNRAGIPFNVDHRRVIDAQRIFHKKEPRDLSAALQFYCGKEHTGAHGALDDTQATLDVIEGQVARYPDLPRDSENLHDFCDTRDPDWIDYSGKLKWDGSQAVINFGKHQGRSLKELSRNDPQFLRWILKSDFSRLVHEHIRDALEGRFHTR